MALMKCPDCGQDVSNKAKVCIHCGYPIEEYVQAIAAKEKETAEREETEKQKEEEKKKKYWCPSCYKQNKIGVDYCKFCGYRLTPYWKEMPDSALYNKPEVKLALTPEPPKPEKKEFSGVYRYTLFGGKQEVYCPRCGNENCSHYQEQKIIPGKVKTRYTANLNPLRPFTLVNKKGKVVRKEEIKTKNKLICNSCGYVSIDWNHL